MRYDNPSISSWSSESCGGDKKEASGNLRLMFKFMERIIHRILICLGGIFCLQETEETQRLPELSAVLVFDIGQRNKTAFSTTSARPMFLSVIHVQQATLCFFNCSITMTIKIYSVYHININLSTSFLK